MCVYVHMYVMYLCVYYTYVQIYSILHVIYVKGQFEIRNSFILAFLQQNFKPVLLVRNLQSVPLNTDPCK